ncbi:C3a anaphylatoxin chemotactic receptor-like [Danio rerio]|uniref:C3a anaphylatoxin chemotactic receptor-like n=1 Tax=Danio rerio TaxID=7955 RepID=A0AC58HDI8_DANRE
MDQDQHSTLSTALTSQNMGNVSIGPENGTEEDSTGIRFIIFLASIFFATFVMGLIGNGLVIFLTACKMKTTVNSIWFLNLAIADIIFLISTIIGFTISLEELQSDFMIHFFSITASLNQFASVLFLVVISLDRCLCTWMTVWAQNNRTLRKARIICLIVWVSSIGYILPFFEVFEVTDTFLSPYQFILLFLIPFLIIASSYIAIGVKIKRLKKRKQFRSYRLIITVILTFFICSFPQYVWYFIILTENNDKLSDSDSIWMLFIFSMYLIYLNSSLNPFLYVFMCNDYKKKLKQSLVLVLETAFAEDHLDIKEMRQTQNDKQAKQTTLELLEM